jgi:hypothetical protein
VQCSSWFDITYFSMKKGLGGHNIIFYATAILVAPERKAEPLLPELVMLPWASSATSLQWWGTIGSF